MNAFKIFPATVLPDGKKIPLVDSWQERATNDPKQIQLWQEQFGERLKLWGAPTGSVNGIFVLDIDVKKGVNGFEKLKELGITEFPNTAFQQTPSGGYHLIFKNDSSLNLRNTANAKLACDTRAEGGWIGLYNIQNLHNIAPIPQWIHEVIRKPVNQIDPTQVNTYQLDPLLALQQYEQSLQSVLAAQPGERNQTLNTHAYVIGKLVVANQVSYERAFADLTNAAKQIGLDPFETQATILSGLKGGVANPLTHPFGDKPPTPALQIEAPVPVAALPLRWTPRFATLDDMTNWSKLKRPQLFKDWAPQDLILTSAVGGIGKSTIKLYESVCLALGESFLGFECVSPGRTLFIIGEDSVEKIYAMLGRICKQMGLFEPGQEHRLKAVRENVVVKLDYDLSLVAFDQRLRNYIVNQEAVAKIKEAIDDLQPKHIIFDPIGIFGGSEAGGNDSAKAMMQAVQKIRDMSDAAIDIISHIGKNSATSKDTSQFSARGATSLANHSRVVRTLLKLNTDEYRERMNEDLPEGQTAIECYVSKFSDGSPLLDKPFIIIRDGFLFSRREIPARSQGATDGDANKDMMRVYQFIKANSTEAKPVNEKIVSDHFYLQSPRIPKGESKSMVSMLKVQGLIEEVEHADLTVGKYLRSVT